MENDGDFSAWNGHRPVHRVPTCLSDMRSEANRNEVGRVAYPRYVLRQDAHPAPRLPSGVWQRHFRTDLVIALDVDGVLVTDGQGEHWLHVVARELDMPAEDVEPFFQQHWAHVVTGQRTVGGRAPRVQARTRRGAAAASVVRGVQRDERRDQ